ncbi:hypothetical protein GCM10009678_42890 [Actinomadura kijaniata]|uniref:Uncharacterized protein n=1 Tax=Actinomadura namibiensis TaxID=182080 RepID=A0A7W3LU41_ACTNM|nr:hypothetical protein [Actinomadura namibiensis]MBA8954321.1 hypothetical protein [Actinomadura namibiensis]
MTASPERALAMRLAAEVVKAAYEEAMRRHGLLPSTVALISDYAEQNLAALHAEGQGEEIRDG